jgi:hypothetical protein
MATLFQASAQWASRPSDERFTSLLAMQDHVHGLRRVARSGVVSSRSIEARPDATDQLNKLQIVGKAGIPYAPSHWAFGQLASLAGAPAGYLRKLPAPMAADCLNWGLKKERDVADIGLYLNAESKELMAATGPNYGRVYNSDVVDALVDRFGNGIDGAFRVPGEFGQRVQVTKGNTTLFAGDRDMFVFLADEENRITVPNRRNGEAGTMARGFFCWNSEVGAGTLGVAMFLFDYVCCNRIVWGARDFREVKVRHTSGAPDRFLEEVRPVMLQMAASSTKSVDEMLVAARASRLDDANEWLSKRFTSAMATSLQLVHTAEEGRPIETLWDVSTALTAKAKSIVWQDERVAMERQAGAVLDLALN